MGIWPWSRFQALTRERDEAIETAELVKYAGRINRALVEIAFFHDPTTGRMHKQGIVPRSLMEKVRREQAW